jgi:hypothetical protein
MINEPNVSGEPGQAPRRWLDRPSSGYMSESYAAHEHDRLAYHWSSTFSSGRTDGESARDRSGYYPGTPPGRGSGLTCFRLRQLAKARQVARQPLLQAIAKRDEINVSA